jgi:LysR family transcriptional regulator, low CO2-responsive transcriptional regulator
MSIDLRISLRKLEVLSLVVQLGGVGRAAEHLFVAQPVVTAHIRSIEERVGAKLFYREGRQMHLTEAGQAVHRWAEDLLTRTRELERYLDGISEGSQGTVVFGASMSVGSYELPSVLTTFRASHPDVDLRLGVSDTEHAIEDTRAGVFDFAVVVSEEQLELPGMEVERVGTDTIVLVAAPGGEPDSDVITVDELRRLPFIDAPEGIVRRTFVDRQLRQLGIRERNVVLQLGHPEAMKRATRAGLGVTLLFHSAVREELETGTLREVRVEGADLALPIYIVFRKGKIFSPLHHELVQEIQRTLADGASPSEVAPTVA